MPTTNTPKQLAERLRNLVRSTEGDDFGRARRTFAHCSPEEMQEQWGQSGRTRQQVLDGYTEARAEQLALQHYVECLTSEDFVNG